MTSLDVGAILKHDQNRPSFSDIAGRVKTSPRNESWWEDALYVLGKPEEWASKGIGRLYSDDPKYYVDSKNLYDQVSFYDTAQDITGAEGSTGVLANLPLALAMAVLNPTDPLNLIGIGKATKLGNLGKIAAKAERVNGLWKLPVKRLLAESAQEIEEKVSKNLLTQKQGQKALKKLASQEKDLVEIDRYLESLQVEKGMSIEEITETGNFFDQVRKGQRTIIGFDPYQNPIIRRLARKGKQSLATQSATKIPGLDRVLAPIIEPIHSSVGKMREYGARGLNLLGANIPITEVEKAASKIIHDMDKARNTGQSYNVEQALRQYNWYGMNVTKDDMLKIIDGLEDRFGAVEIRELRSVVEGSADDVFDKRLGRDSQDLLPRAVGVRGVDRTRQQQQLYDILEPETRRPEFAEAAEAQQKASDAMKAGSFVQARVATRNDIMHVDPEHIVIRIPTGQDAHKANIEERARRTAATKLPGIMPSRVVKGPIHGKDDGFFLVQRNGGVSLDTEWTPLHFSNLEKIMALAAQKGWAFDNLSAGMIMLGKNGEVQIVNPTALRKVKRVGGQNITDTAVGISRNSFRNILDKVGKSQDYDFHLLGEDVYSRRTIKRISADSLELNDNAPNAKRLIGSSDIKYYATQDLLRAQNAQLAKALDDEDVLEQFGIFGIADSIQREQVMEPVIITVDDYGNVHIKDGVERLAAANVLGLENVPVIRDDFIGEVSEEALAQGANRSVRSGSKSSSQAFDDLPSSYTLFDDPTQQVMEDARIVENDHVIGLSPTGEGSPFHKAQQLQLVRRFKDFLTRRGTSEARSLGWQYMRKIDNLIDEAFSINKLDPTTHNRAFVELYDLVMDQPNPEGIYYALNDVYGMELTPPYDRLWMSKDDRLAIRAELEELKGMFKEAYDYMVDHGAFLVGDTDGMGSYAMRTNRVVIRNTTGELEFIAPWMTQEQLQGFTKQFMTTKMAETTGSAKVHLLADVPLTVMAEDMLDIARPKFRSINPDNTKFFHTSAKAQELAKQGIYINPTPSLLKEKGWADQYSRLAKSPRGVFAISMSGSLIFAPGMGNVEDMLGLVFGDAPRYVQEFGTVDGGIIHVGNLSGMTGIDEINAANIARVEERMVKIAHRLKNAGIDTSVKVDFHTRYGDLWKKLYPEPKRISDLVKGDSGVKIPENLDGVSLHLYDERVPTRVKSRAEDFEEGPVRELFKEIEADLEAVALEELKNGLPLSVHEAYYPRFLTPPLLRKLDELGHNFFSKNHNEKYFDYWINNFKGRSFSDLTTKEVNDLFNALQIDNTDLVAFDKANGSDFMKTLAEVDPTASAYFIQDPILAVAHRKMQSIKAISGADAYRAMSKPMKEGGLAIYSGTVDDWYRKQNMFNMMESAQANVDELKASRDAAQDALSQLEQADADLGAIADAQKTLRDSQARLDQATSRLVSAQAHIAEVSPMLDSVDKAFDTVAVDTRWARQQVIDGVISEQAIIAGDWAAPYVRIQVGTLKQAGLGNAKISVFHREALDWLDKHYAMLYNKGGAGDKFFKMFDKVNNIFKQFTLFFGPSTIPYNVRNFFSNFYLGWLSDIDESSYVQAFEGLQLVSRYNKGGMSIEDGARLLESRVYSNAVGEQQSLKTLWDEFVKGGGLAGGLHVNEFGMSDALLERSVKHGFSPASDLVATSFFTDNKLLRFGRDVASAVENRFRFAAFMDTWLKGGSFPDAMLNVKKTFYNYDDLTVFEKKTLKRIFPFYSWSRFNTPRMLETLATRPVVHYRMRKAMADIERGAGGPASEGEIQDWLAERMHVVIDRVDGKLVVMGADYLLPIGDLRRLFTDPGRFAIDSVTPVLKYPIEQLFNKSLFTFTDIEKVEGQVARSGTLRSLGMSRRATPHGPLGALNIIFNESLASNVRPVKWITDWLDWAWFNSNLRGEQPKLASRLFDAVIARAYTQDPYAVQAWKQVRNSQYVQTFEYEAKRAMSMGDPATAEYYRSQIADWLTINE